VSVPGRYPEFGSEKPVRAIKSATARLFRKNMPPDQIPGLLCRRKRRSGPVQECGTIEVRSKAVSKVEITASWKE
jgi:hypothetical protein